MNMLELSLMAGKSGNHDKANKIIMGYIFFIIMSLIRLGWIQDVIARATSDGSYIGRGKIYLIGVSVTLVGMAILFWQAHLAMDDTVR